MRILGANEVKTSTITVNSEASGYEFDIALKETRVSRKGRTVGLTAEYIVFNLGSAKAIDYIVILSHNFTSSVNAHIQGNATDSWGAPSVDQHITYSDDTMVYNFTSAETYQYWRLLITDDTNTAGYIEISKVYIGDYIQMPYMAKDAKLPLMSTSDIDESTSGQIYGNAGHFFRSGSVTFPYITDAERLVINAFYRLTDKYIPFIVLWWESDLTTEPPIYARLTNDLEWTRAQFVGKIWSLSFQIKEVF